VRQGRRGVSSLEEAASARTKCGQLLFNESLGLRKSRAGRWQSGPTCSTPGDERKMTFHGAGSLGDLGSEMPSELTRKRAPFRRSKPSGGKDGGNSLVSQGNAASSVVDALHLAGSGWK